MTGLRPRTISRHDGPPYEVTRGEGTFTDVCPPYWTDMVGVEVCVLEETDSLTVQWTGSELGSGASVQVQTVLRSDGSVEVLYGPDHAGTGLDDPTAVGIENADGSVGVGAELPVAGGESITFVPAP